PAVRRIGRDQIGDIAYDEDLARPRIEDRLGRGARIAAGDHHDGGVLLALAEAAIAFSFRSVPSGAKTGITIEKPLRKGNAHSRSELKQKCGRRKHPQSIGPKQFSDRRMRRKIRPPFRSSEMAVWCPAPHSANST